MAGVTWLVKGERFGSQQLARLLREGWEPFAATTSMPDVYTVWCRRRQSTSKPATKP